MAGTINISRDLWEDEAFASSPFSEREAWIWMIAEASWKPRTRRIGDYIIDTQRGQMAGSVRFMAKAWQWTPSKVQRFLARLEKLGLIRSKTDTRVSVITICKYNEYQSGGKTADTPPIQSRYTSDTNEKKGEIRDKLPEANASGRDASQAPSADEDFSKQVFDRAVAFLGRHGVKEAQARSFVGKLRKSGVADAEIFDAFAACSKAGAVDPIPWITARLKPKPPPEPAINDNVLRLVAEINEAEDQRLRAMR